MVGNWIWGFLVLVIAIIILIIGLAAYYSYGKGTTKPAWPMIMIIIGFTLFLISLILIMWGIYSDNKRKLQTKFVEFKKEI